MAHGGITVYITIKIATIWPWWEICAGVQDITGEDDSDILYLVCGAQRLEVYGTVVDFYNFQWYV